MLPNEQLLIKKYDLNKAYAELDGLYPLSYAAKYGVIHYLLSIGEPIASVLNQANDNGFTALHFACRYGQIETAQYLISKGALSTPTKSTGHYPIHLAFDSKNKLKQCEALFMILKIHGLDNKTNANENLAHMAALKGSIKILQCIHQESPALLNAKNNFSLTPLLVAVINNEFDTVDFLLKTTDVTIKNSKAQNALHLAAYHASCGLFKLLLPYYDIHIRDDNGLSVSDIAKKSKQVDKENLIKQWQLTPSPYSQASAR